MPTWGELKEYARSKYALNNDDEEGFSIVFEFDDDRTQLIGVHHCTAFDKDWIEFRTYVCKENEMSPKVALRKNDDFALGGLALDDDGDYCLLYQAQLDTLDPEEFELPLTETTPRGERARPRHARRGAGMWWLYASAAGPAAHGRERTRDAAPCDDAA